MNEPFFKQEENSRIQVIATSGSFQIELMEYVGSVDNKGLIKISNSLVKEYGKHSILT
mgnify:FL=1